MDETKIRRKEKVRVERRLEKEANRDSEIREKVRGKRRE